MMTKPVKKRIFRWWADGTGRRRRGLIMVRNQPPAGLSRQGGTGPRAQNRFGWSSDVSTGRLALHPADGKMSQFRRVLEAEFVFEGFPISLDGLDAQI